MCQSERGFVPGNEGRASVRCYVVWPFVLRVLDTERRPDHKCWGIRRTARRTHRNIHVLVMDEDGVGRKDRIDGPQRPSLTFVAEIEAPTWPILGQKKVELLHAPVPRCKINAF